MARRDRGEVPRSGMVGWPQSLWLVRHGESQGNVANALALKQRALRLEVELNDAQIDLSSAGVEQAKALGGWIGAHPSDEQPTVALVSPYVRARETARIVLDEADLAGLPISYDERLRDREQGVLDRLTGAGFRDRYPEESQRQSYVGKFWYRPTGGESWADVVLRVRSVLLDLRLSLAGERVLVVSHDMTILAFRYVLESLTPDEALALSGRVQNCSVTKFEHEGRGLTLRAFSDTRALEMSRLAPVTARD
jgi:broad specificity phosphatase PhoE